MRATVTKFTVEDARGALRKARKAAQVKSEAETARFEAVIRQTGNERNVQAEAQRRKGMGPLFEIGTVFENRIASIHLFSRG